MSDSEYEALPAAAPQANRVKRHRFKTFAQRMEEVNKPALTSSCVEGTGLEQSETPGFAPPLPSTWALQQRVSSTRCNLCAMLLHFGIVLDKCGLMARDGVSGIRVTPCACMRHACTAHVQPTRHARDAACKYTMGTQARTHKSVHKRTGISHRVVSIDQVGCYLTYPAWVCIMPPHVC